MPTGIYKREPFTIKHKQNISIGKKGNNGRKGIFHTEGTKRKMSEVAKGRILSEEIRIKISNAKKGIRVSPETEFKKGYKQSQEEKQERSLRWTGKLNPNWKGGVSSVLNIIRHSQMYKIWRKSIFVRDNYTCVVCKQVGGKINAHHIKSFADYPELRFDIDNGITLCKKCHELTDNYKNKKEIN